MARRSSHPRLVPSSRFRRTALPLALPLALVAGALTACDRPLPVESSPGQRVLADRAPSVQGGILERQDLVGGLLATTDRAHWADGYVWANDPTSATYTPSTFYSFNRTGNAISITKTAGTIGQYTVRLTGLTAFLSGTSTVHVTGYLGDDSYCKPVGARLVNDAVGVRCFKASTGAAVDAYYTVLITRNYTDVAYAFADNPTGTGYAPPLNASWNPGGAITVTRSGPGVYSVRFTGLGTLTSSNGGQVQVTAVGTGKGYCKVGGWGGSPDLVISVGCFNRSGTAADSKFEVLFVLPSAHLAYAWGDQPSAASYTPSTFYSSNPSGGAISVSRLGTGRYNITWTGASTTFLDGGDVQVTAYGGGNAQCKVEGWGSESATLRCFSPNGTLVDSFFTVLMGT